MGIFDEAHVTVLTADFIGIDAAGKVNALGAGYALMGLNPGTMSPQQHVIAQIDIPGHLTGQEFSVSLELYDETARSVFQVPGQSGEPEALRMQQVVRAERPGVQGFDVPGDVFCRFQVSIGFPTGLPLKPATLYSWRVEIDGQRREHWRSSFYVAAPAQQQAPVFGGPIGPADLPR